MRSTAWEALGAWLVNRPKALKRTSRSARPGSEVRRPDLDRSTGRETGDAADSEAGVTSLPSVARDRKALALAAFAIAGYALFGFAAGTYLARKVPSGRAARGALRALSRLSHAASFIAPAAALFDLFARIAVIASLLAGAPIPRPLLAPTLLALNLKGIAWIAFLWLLCLSVFLLVRDWMVKRRARRVSPH